MARAAELSESLLVGAGPAAAALVPMLSGGFGARVDMVTRASPRGREFGRQLAAAGGRITARAAEPRFARLAGEGRVRRFFLGYQGLAGGHPTVFLCTPADRYSQAVASLARAGALRPGQRLILLSAGFGSGTAVADALRREGQDPAAFTVASFSNYFAATKHPARERTEVLHKGLKRRVYVGLSRRDPGASAAISKFLGSVGVDAALLPGTLAAESRNITTYVHPPLFISPWALERVLTLEPRPGFMYKLYPEGPITREALRTMARLSVEANAVLKRLKIAPLNLLKFLNDDNYPVPEQVLSRAEIEGYPRASETERTLLLYARYATLLVDPYSTPDPETGRRRDFSAVPFPRVTRLGPGRCELPRVPLEDYKTLLVLGRLASRLGVSTPTIGGLCRLFARSVRAFERRERLSTGLDFAAVARERARLAGLILKGAR